MRFEELIGVHVNGLDVIIIVDGQFTWTESQ